jgi:hypothetical protein
VPGPADWQQDQQRDWRAGSYGGRHGRRAAGRRGRGTVAAIAALAIGLAAVALAVTGVNGALAPRKFTQAQARQIMAWEVAARWRELPAGVIFPATTTYQAPEVLQDGGSLTLTTRRLAIAHRATCERAADPAAAAVLGRYGCQALLRASYVDGTASYLVTVGVAAFASAAQASAAQRALSDPGFSHAGQEGALAPGVRAATFPGTAAAGFTDARRQLAGSINDGPYVLLYTIGYADNRPKLPVDVDNYTYAEMSSLGQGLAKAIGGKLTTRPPTPYCPGAPGC